MPEDVRERDLFALVAKLLDSEDMAGGCRFEYSVLWQME